MNTVGVILSASALLVALVELRLRADLAGRRMCAMLVTCSWLTMSGVAWDCHRQCQDLYGRTNPVLSKQDIPVPLREYPRETGQLAQTGR